MPLKALMIAVLLFGIPWTGCSLIGRANQRNLLPQKLSTGWFYAEGSCSRFLSYQGAFAFNLSPDTIAALKLQGVGYFEDINEPHHAARTIYFHGAWKATPVPESFFSDGLPGNLNCGESGSWFWPRGIPEALRQPGGYYQSSGRRIVFVLPDLGWVVASASDR